MSNLIIFFIVACSPGLDALNDVCPGGSNCWCPWDTAHEYYPPLDENDHIICDTGNENDRT
jgi:hypothetical protein